MNLNFKTLAILSAVIFSSLALARRLASGVVLSSWGVEFSYSAVLIGVAFSLAFVSVAHAGHKEMS